MDHTVRTKIGIVLRSVRSACGNGLFTLHLPFGESVRLKAYVQLFQ